MAQDQDEIAAQAAETTVALNPLVGVNRQELVGAVAMLLRRTATSPVATAKLAGKMTREGYKIARGRSEIQPDPKDRRFKDPAWQHNPFYKRGVQTYLAMQDGLHEWVGDLKLSEMEHARAQFVMGMIVDALSPTNTLLGNPAARKRAIDSGGLSLMKGLKNAYDDLIHNGGMPAQVDKRPFKSVRTWRRRPAKWSGRTKFWSSSSTTR